MLSWMHHVALSLFHKLVCLYIIVIRCTDYLIIVPLALVYLYGFVSIRIPLGIFIINSLLFQGFLNSLIISLHTGYQKK